MPYSPAYKGDPAILALGSGFFDPVEPARFPKTTLRYRNDRAAATVGLESLNNNMWLAHFAHFDPLPGTLMEPLAQRYHGHQFRVYNPDIGDGRGFLYAQLRDTKGRLMDLGTKGSGTTPYSRGGDGRLTLKGGVREILATEMLEALGANVSKTVSLVETHESLHRGDEPSPTRSAVMVRLNHSHMRIGTFQRLAYATDTKRLNRLVAYCLKHYYGTEPTGTDADFALQFLALVRDHIAVQAAELIATGFVHGVLNTDNINITGEIFDFGPWRFLPTLDPNFTAAYFDETGLYAYGRQPDALHWNIYQLGGALADIAEQAALKEVLADFPDLYQRAVKDKTLARLGVKPKNDQSDEALLRLVNDFMGAQDIAYERFFFDWYGGAASRARAFCSPESARYQSGKAAEMVTALSAYQPTNPAALNTPYFQGDTPCTLLIDEVEEIWSHIDERDDWAPLNAKIDSIRQMGDALRP